LYLVGYSKFCWNY